MENKTTKCEICETTFPYQKKKRYCSSTCRRKAFEQRLLNVPEEKAKALQVENDDLRKTLSVTKNVHKKTKKLVATIKEVPGSYSPEKVKEIEAEAEILLQELLKLKF